MNQIYKLLLSIVLLSGMNAFGQSSTYWEYSVFGIGDIQPNGFGQSRGMGGVGIALPCETSINDINPACLQGIDYSTVILDIGADSRWSQFYDGNYVQNNTTINFNFFSLGFRTADRWVCSIGLTPYTLVGTNIVTQIPIEGSLKFITDYYSGSGGINKFYWSNSFKISNNLAVGLNIKYLFGSVQVNQTLDVLGSNYSILDNQYMSKLVLDYGFLYKFTLNHNINGTIGGIFSNPWTLAIRHEQTISTDTVLRYLIDTLSTYKLPMTYGLGFALKFYNKLTLSFDYSYGQWSKAYESVNINATSIPFYPATNLQYNAQYVNASNFNFGAEFLPSDAYSASFISKVKYRFGARYSNTPLMISGNQLTDMALSCGFGIPLLRNRLNANIAFEVGHRGNDSGYGLTIENYGTVMVNLTFLENWFLKRKFN